MYGTRRGGLQCGFDVGDELAAPRVCLAEGGDARDLCKARADCFRHIEEREGDVQPFQRISCRDRRVHAGENEVGRQCGHFLCGLVGDRQGCGERGHRRRLGVARVVTECGDAAALDDLEQDRVEAGI